MIYAVRSNGASDPNHEPPIFQGSVLGRDHRIAVGGSRQEERCWRSACSRPGAGKTSNTGQSASKRGVTRGDKRSVLIIKVRERMNSPAQTAQTMSGQANR